MAWLLDTPGGQAAASPRRWRVSGYADVRAALANPELRIPGSADATTPPRDRVSSHESSPDTAVLAKCALALLTAARRDAADAGVDLVSQVAMPYGAYVASATLGLPAELVQEVLPAARIVWHDAAMARMPGASQEAREATMEMLHVGGESHATRPGVPPQHLQALVALTHSLPALLGNVFAYLLQHPLSGTAWQHQQRQVVEELLRVAGPARLVYRVVHHWPDVPGVEAQAGDVVAIDLESANTDVTVWSAPTQLALTSDDTTRTHTPHVAFGWTPHACVGAQIIRRALTGMLEAWMQTFGEDRVRYACEAVEQDLVTMRAMRLVRVWHHAVERQSAEGVA